MTHSTHNGALNTKYGHFERERRFLINELPKDLIFRFTIKDKYLPGSQLRLRQTINDDGHSIWKLGQKIRINESDPSEILHTSMYLKESEFDDLSSIQGNRLEKSRYNLKSYPESFSVDLFHGALTGLRMLEVDFGSSTDSMTKFIPPKFCSLEVTQDERFTGAMLATLNAADLKMILAEVLR